MANYAAYISALIQVFAEADSARHTFEVCTYKVPTGDVDDGGLSAQERRELVVNRCFVVCTKDHADLFPYDDRWSVRTD